MNFSERIGKSEETILTDDDSESEIRILLIRVYQGDIFLLLMFEKQLLLEIFSSTRTGRIEVLSGILGFKLIFVDILYYFFSSRSSRAI